MLINFNKMIDSKSCTFINILQSYMLEIYAIFYINYI